MMKNVEERRKKKEEKEEEMFLFLFLFFFLCKPRNWTRRWSAGSHLVLPRWSVVEGSEKNRRFEETPSAALLAAVASRNSEDEDDVEEEEESRAVRRTRTGARGEEFGLFVHQPANTANANANANAAAAAAVNLTRYRCPLEGCGQMFFKVAGLLAHTRMKHKIRKDKVDIPACRITMDQDGNLTGPSGAAPDEDEGDEEPEMPPPRAVAAAPVAPPPAPSVPAAVEPEKKKMKLVLKLAKLQQ